MDGLQARTPTDGTAATRVFLGHSGTRLLAAAALLFISLRVALGGWSAADALAVAAVVAAYPLFEWGLHRFLHGRLRLFGRSWLLDMQRTHRRHHQQPWSLTWMFFSRRAYAQTILLMLATLAALWPWKATALSGLSAAALLLLHYEWVHYLAHIRWCPRRGALGAYYAGRVRAHRCHHFRDETLWWGIASGLGDRVFGTAPPPQSVAKGASGTGFGQDGER